MSVGSNSLETHTYLYTLHIDLQSSHTHTGSFTHKVQVSASRTAIGAVLPIGFILFSLFFTMSLFHIYIPRCIHLLSIQSLAGTVLSFHPPSIMWGWLHLSLFPHCFKQPVCRSAVSCPSSYLWKHKSYIFPWSRDISWSADILLTGLRIQKEETHFATQEVDMDLK